ncbi:signal peptide protein [Massilia sp. JS1662]|nr:transporter [Massilia sp. JS1662]KGF80259.1 signal peptide protein [Massilia sp. JS1662]
MNASLFRPACTVLALSLLAGAASANENNAPVVPFGVLDFGAGMLPPPSPFATVGVRAASFRGDRLVDANGDTAPVGASQAVNSYGFAVIKMTDHALFGGTWGWAAVLPVLDMHLDLAIPTPGGTLRQSGSNRAQGDLQVTPVIVAWQPAPNLFVNASLSLQVPTGSYARNRLISAGVNHWTVSPAVAFTYLTPDGVEVSSNVMVNVHTENHATRYRTGSEYQHEFALGRHAGAWTIGVGGYFIAQFDDDRVNGAATSGNRSKVLALGPAVQFFDPPSGWPLVTGHFYKNVMQRNRADGEQFAVKAAWTF